MEEIRSWTAIRLFLVIVLGAGVYGSSIGIWRAPLQALYAGLKFPPVILVTLILNIGLNGTLAQLAGLHIGYAKTMRLLLEASALASIILGVLAPVLWFFTLQCPPIGSTNEAVTYGSVLLSHVFVIALAGCAAHLQLARSLRSLMTGNNAEVTRATRRVVLGWLLGNMFLGCQISWILRPFIGSPLLEVRFLREHPLVGNFYEAVWLSIRQVIFGG